MKCPACGKRLNQIIRGHAEYACYNDQCPSMKNGCPGEFYGSQEEVNKLWGVLK